MSIREKLARLARKAPSDQWAAIKATVRSVYGSDTAAVERQQYHVLITGPHAPPRVLQNGNKIYVAYRPDADAIFMHHPEITQLSEKWIKNNVMNNAGDLPRLYALILNIKQVLVEHITGDMAELGVYRGNSAAVLAHYARQHSRRVWLFDTFQGFDERDLVGGDEAKPLVFGDTSIDQVRDIVGEDAVRFVKGRFPQSVPAELYESRFCLAHIDCDLYEPTKAGLEFFYPRLSPGGLLIVHDYANPWWDGIKRAVDEYCTVIPEKLVVFGDKSGTAMIRKSAVP
jgi:macrocin-O-methyltransferase TylF-like protien